MSCAATFAGGYHQSAMLPIGVSPASAVVLQPAKLTFTSTASKNVNVSQAGYTGSFAESDTCGTVASVTAASKP